jgi:uncharacterized protein YndB with AHSA1/START domain
MDVRSGGSWRMALRSAAGTLHVKQRVDREIRPPELLVFTWQWLDPAGMAGPETVVTVTFEQQRGCAKLILRLSRFETAAIRDDHRTGWSGCMDRFAAYIANA